MFWPQKIQQVYWWTNASVLSTSDLSRGTKYATCSFLCRISRLWLCSFLYILPPRIKKEKIQLLCALSVAVKFLFVTLYYSYALSSLCCVTQWEQCLLINRNQFLRSSTHSWWLAVCNAFMFGFLSAYFKKAFLWFSTRGTRPNGSHRLWALWDMYIHK